MCFKKEEKRENSPKLELCHPTERTFEHRFVIGPIKLVGKEEGKLREAKTKQKWYN
jgi:hypothetical protein